MGLRHFDGQPERGNRNVKAGVKPRTRTQLRNVDDEFQIDEAAKPELDIKR